MRRPQLDANLRPMHGGAVMKPVGSTAVSDAIVRHQPMLSVHGHIHESRGIKKMGRTLAMNPGSVYGDGVLQGAVLELDAEEGQGLEVSPRERLSIGALASPPDAGRSLDP